MNTSPNPSTRSAPARDSVAAALVTRAATAASADVIRQAQDNRTATRRWFDGIVEIVGRDDVTVTPNVDRTAKKASPPKSVTVAAGSQTIVIGLRRLTDDQRELILAAA